MPFKWERPEKKEVDLEKLKGLEQAVAARLNAEGVPVDDNCRIKMDAPEDVRLAEELERKWQEKEGERIKKDGEQFEILKTIIFNKFLNNDFIIARTSLYDDFVNKVDNVILDKKTGNLVCALDEVADNSGKDFEEKKEKVLARNMKGNENMLKYGLLMENGKMVPGGADHFPLFYLALPHDRIREAIERMAPSLDEKSDYETKLFSYFVSSIDTQIKTLKLYPRLDNILKESIAVFESSLKKLGK